jgi:tetratricopeptide (TPR) repeat protein
VRRPWLSIAAAACLHLAACAGVVRGDRSAQELAQAAQAQLAQGNAAEARASFEAALARDPRLLAAVRGRIEASRRLGLLPELLAEAEARTQAAPADGIGFYQLGLARFAKGDEPGALAALTRATELLPQQADAWYRLGVLLFDGERFDAAKAPLLKAVELGPQAARYRIPLATCLGRLGDAKGALAQLAQVPQLSPSAEEAQLAVQAARALTDPFRGLSPEAKAAVEQALGFLVKDAPGLAVPVLEAILEKQPQLGPAHALLGLAAQRMDEAGKAATELKRAAELLPEAPQPHAWLGELYASKEKPELAAQEYRLALARNPLDVATLRKLALVHLGQSAGAQEALAPLRAAAALEPSDAALAVLLARTELQLPGEAARGRQRLERLAEERPSDPEVLLRLAQALGDQRASASEPERSALGQRAASLAKRVLELQPGNAAAARLAAQAP